LDNEIYLKMKNKTEKQFLLGDGTSGKGEWMERVKKDEYGQLSLNTYMK
jgi:hypothetical protein